MPYEMVARFNGTCAETGLAIEKGERVLYYPLTRQMFSAAAVKQWEDYRAFKAELYLAGE